MNSALLRIYDDKTQEPGMVMIQESESMVALVPGSKADRAELVVRQAWMVASRKWTDIPKKTKHDDSRGSEGWLLVSLIAGGERQASVGS